MVFTMHKNRIWLYLSICLVAILCATTIKANDKTYRGWESGSEYNKLYNYKERDKFKGYIKSFKKITPLPGMAPATAFLFDDGGETILVHVCPWDWANPKQTGLRKGVRTTVKGSWALIDDEDVFMAAKVSQGDDFVFKVRLTKNGKPFWNMGKEELELELKNTQ